ncbi:phage tail tape measure protein [Streptomyces bacillaris]|uniref:phage tail tape measure protein n=1 Tax=Streptomyces bacillaris TaxID=68179 RepID=UPI00381D4D47
MAGAMKVGTAFIDLVARGDRLFGQITTMASRAGVTAGRSLNRGMTQGLSGVNRGMAGAGLAVQALGTRVQNTGRQIQQAGQGFQRWSAPAGAAASAVKPLALGVAALGAGVIKTGMDFDTSMAKLKGVTGAPKKEIALLEKTARQLGATTKFSASQAADGMGFLAMAGMKTNEIVAVTPFMLDLASAANMDLARTSDVVTNVMSGMGLGVDQAGRAVDVMAKAAMSGNTDIEMLGQAFKYVGPVAKSFGMSLEEAAASMSVLGDNGIQADMAGTAMRGMLTRLNDTSGKATKIAKKYGIELRDQDGKFIGLTASVNKFARAGVSTTDVMTAFGQRAGPAFLALMGDDSRKKLNRLNAEMKNSEGAARSMAKAYEESAKGRLLNFKSAVEELALQMWDGGLRDATKNTLDGLTALARGFGALPNGVRQSVVALLMVPMVVFGVAKAVTGTARLVTGFGRSVAGAGRVLVAVGKAPVAFARGLALLPTRLGLMALSLRQGTAAAGGFAARTATATASAVTSFTRTATSAVASGARTSAAWVASAARSAASFALMATRATLAGGRIAAVWVGQAVAGAASFAASMVRTAAVAVAQFVMMAARAVIWAATMAAQWIIAMGPVAWVIAAVVGLVVAVVANWDKIRAATAAVWDWIWSKIKSVWELIKAGATLYFTAYRVVILAAWAAIKSATSAAWTAIRALISGVWRGIRAVITAGTNAAKALMRAGFAACRAVTASTWAAIRGLISAAVAGIRSILGWFGRLGGLFRGWWNSAVTATRTTTVALIAVVRGIPGRITGALGNMGSLLYNKGRDVISGMIRGISSMTGALWSKASSVASSIKDKLNPTNWFRASFVPDDGASPLPGPFAPALASVGRSTLLGAPAVAPMGYAAPLSLGGAVGGAFSSMAAAFDAGSRGGASVGDLGNFERAANRAADGAVGRRAGATITVNARTDANPYEIGKAIAWEMRTSGR